jgi:Glyoxalase-like domain
MMPPSLDHIILGSSDLERGIVWMEERTGVRAAFGGAHPGRGTHNALLQLGPRCYLEILAPDPRQTSPSRYAGLQALREPRLVTWATCTADIEWQAGRARAAGFAIIGPENNSRTRPDGRILRWRFFRLQDDLGGLLPFFIEWSRDSVHPAADAPAGCRLDRFLLQSPVQQELSEACEKLGLDVPVERGDEALLRAQISSPKGEVELRSLGDNSQTASDVPNSRSTQH